jgi:hypothetical protein
MMNLEAGNRIGNSIEDKKRTVGMGYGFDLTINKAYFD